MFQIYKKFELFPKETLLIDIFLQCLVCALPLWTDWDVFNFRSALIGREPMTTKLNNGLLYQAY